MQFFTSLLASILLLTTMVAAYANPKTCSGTCTNAHDPSIIRRDSDGKYFRFSTGGKIAIHTAPAITGPWTYIGAMLPSCSKIALSGNCDLWAPSVHKVGSLYHIYYSVSTFGSQTSSIGLATSSTMDAGSFTDVGATGVSSTSAKPYNAIDPSLIQINGAYYLNFGSFWSDIYQVPLTSDAKKPSGSSSYQLAYTSSGSHAEEGPYMINYGGYYYLFYSAGVCCGYDLSRPAAGQEYKIKVCRSSSATGGFVDKNGVSCATRGGTVVLESHGNVYGPGGQSLYNDPTYGWVLVYHYVNTAIGYGDGQKQFGWNQIVWSGGWPTV